MSLDHCLQILLDDERHQRLVALAAERDVSVAAVVREAIDRGLPVPEPDELRDELDTLRGRRG